MDKKNWTNDSRKAFEILSKCSRHSTTKGKFCETDYQVNRLSSKREIENRILTQGEDAILWFSKLCVLNFWSHRTYDYRYFIRTWLSLRCNKSRFACLETRITENAPTRFMAWLGVKWKHFAELSRSRWTYGEREKWKTRHARSRGVEKMTNELPTLQEDENETRAPRRVRMRFLIFSTPPQRERHFRRNEQEDTKAKKCRCCCWRGHTKIEVSEIDAFI